MDVSKCVSTEIESVELSWDRAIVDAQIEIERLERQVKKLRQAKKIFVINKKDGIPWPKNPQESHSK